MIVSERALDAGSYLLGGHEFVRQQFGHITLQRRELHRFVVRFTAMLLQEFGEDGLVLLVREIKRQRKTCRVVRYCSHEMRERTCQLAVAWANEILPDE